MAVFYVLCAIIILIDVAVFCTRPLEQRRKMETRVGFLASIVIVLSLVMLRGLTGSITISLVATLVGVVSISFLIWSMLRTTK